MPLPALASIIPVAGKVVKGIGKFFGKIFKRKRNKGQRLVDRSQSFLQSQLDKSAELRAKAEAVLKKKGITDLQAYINEGGYVQKPPSGILGSSIASGVSRFFTGLRRPQEFSPPPEVMAARSRTGREMFAGASTPGKTPTNMMLVYGIAAIGALLLISKLGKK